jgi:uncharacterized protein (TIGR02996 family)
MAIDEKAIEFAGLPIVDYHPAVGLVLPTMPRRVFHSSDGTEFWAVTLEGDRLTTHSGKPGNAGRKKARALRSPEAAREAYRKLIADKVEEGYAEQKGQGGSTREALAAALAADPDDTASRMAFADYLHEQGEQLPAAAYRVDRDDDDGDIFPHLESLLADPAVGLVQALVIGCWGGEDGLDDSAEVVEALINARDRLLNLRALFLGDIRWGENEISWIHQSDLTGLLTAFPRLEHFRARGGGGLVLKKFRHEHLESLAFEASNLPREVVRAVGASSLPALEDLELWLGTEHYGANTEVGDLKGIFQAKHLPALRYLGLRNSEIVDDVARALAKAPVLERLRVLDLSLGNLSDQGAEALLAIPNLTRLEKLDIHHHYVSPPLVARLRALGIEVDAGDHQEVDDPEGPSAYRYIAHTE